MDVYIHGDYYDNGSENSSGNQDVYKDELLHLEIHFPKTSKILDIVYYCPNGP